MSARLELRGISKQFQHVLANDDVSLSVEEGSIHALLGENGAGKTTLMKIAYGMYRPDSGVILVDGARHEIRSPRQAMDLGIGMVHQHVSLVPNLTVVENIALELKTGFPLLVLKPIAERLEHLSESYQIRVDPWERVENLSVGQLQRVEIMKTLYRDVRILILDEPTSLLTPIETEQLFRVIRDLAAEGRAIVFITHKLREVLTVADRITVLRNGRVQDELDAAHAEESALARLMVGHISALSAVAEGADKVAAPKDPTIRVTGVSSTERGRRILFNVNLDVYPGEILGLAGVEGNGQRELAEILVGLRKADQGQVFISGNEIATLKHNEVMQGGVGFIPDDRQGAGLVLDFSVAENLILRPQRRTGMKKWGFLDWSAIREYAKEAIRSFRISPSLPGTLVRHLSGGNQQRVILARELWGNPVAVIASQPTAGLDVAAAQYVHGVMRSHAKDGAAILLISADLDEVLSLSHRIAVMHDGRIAGVVPSEEATREQIGLLMTGSHGVRGTPGAPHNERKGASLAVVGMPPRGPSGEENQASRSASPAANRPVRKEPGSDA